MEAGAAGALYAAENLLSGAAALIKGITHPTLPLKANLTHITSVPLPRVHHTISVVKGRAYIFGGESAPGVLADNDMHVVILPSSGVLEADYTTVKARPEKPGGEVPAARKKHSSVVIGDSIYIFGGEGVDPENGRVWAFHTVRNSWSPLDPAPATLYPSHRAAHAAAASPLPGPRDITFHEKAPQQPSDPAKVVPEPADADSWGTVFVLGGRDTQTGALLADALAFDVRSRTWSNIPSPAGPPRDGASLALVGNCLYRFGGFPDAALDAPAPATDNDAAVHVLDVSPVWKHAEGGTTPLSSGWSWAPVPSPSAAPAPHARSRAGLTGVTTGQGRNYLLLVNGACPAPNESTTLLDDIWAFQLPAERATAGASKDALRSGLRRDTHEGTWAEVGYRYVDATGEEVAERLGEGDEVKGVGAREGFGVARGTEVDGASVVVWGGVDARGRVLGDGWLVTVDR